MTDEELSSLSTEMKRLFKDIPDPNIFPKKFEFYARLAKYQLDVDRHDFPKPMEIIDVT